MNFCQMYGAFHSHFSQFLKTIKSLLDFENRYYMSNLVVELLTVLLLKKRLSKIGKTDIYGYF